MATTRLDSAEIRSSSPGSIHPAHQFKRYLSMEKVLQKCWLLRRHAHELTVLLFINKDFCKCLYFQWFCFKYLHYILPLRVRVRSHERAICTQFCLACDIINSPIHKTFEIRVNCLLNNRLKNVHYSDIIMGEIASQITSLTIVYSTVVQTQIKENIKAPRQCGEFTGDR